MAQIPKSVSEVKTPSLRAVQAAFARELLEKAAALTEKLSEYGDKRGRFILFGSVARGDVRHDSDLDLLIDFPPDGEDAAFAYVEDACLKLDIPIDLRLFRHCSEKFLSHISSEMKVVQP